MPLPPQLHKYSAGLASIASLQAALGISTLLYSVPLPLAVAHQAGALTLLTVGSRTVYLAKKLL